MNKYILKKTGDFTVEARGDNWSDIEPIELVDSTNGSEIKEGKAQAKMMWSEKGLYIYYDVFDNHIWGSYKENDDPIYNEEVVEIFVGEGKETPKIYFEFQFSPKGVKFDAKIANPTGNRTDSGFIVDIGWDCKHLEYAQRVIKDEEREGYDRGRWITEVFIPWQDLGFEVKTGDYLRANLFRIDGYPKQNSFQSWVPTMEDPANFHVPDKFGLLELAD